MLPMPERDDETLGIKTVPWVCISFFVVYLVVLFTYQLGEQQKQRELADWYQQSGLFELEWENYISWLRISGQIAKADSLTEARQNKDSLTVFQAMAFDPSFERENRLRGDQYWDVDQRMRWEETREEFARRAGALPSVRFGLNPQAPRPSTYLTFHFLHESVIHWLVGLLVLIPFAWATEGSIGPRRMPLMWLASGVLAGLAYIVFVPAGYQPLIGATPVVSAVIGMYLGLFAIKKINFIYFHPKQKAFRTIALPAAILAPLWLVLPLYEYYGGSPAPHAWVAQLAGLVAGAALIQLARQADVAGAEQEVQQEEEEDSARQLRQYLTSGWASMSAMAFTEAEEAFNKVLATHPGHFAALTGLYHIHKIKPESEKFSRTALSLLKSQADGEGEVRQQLTLYRDYLRRAGSDVELPIDVNIQILMCFTRLGDMREAEKVAERIVESRQRHPLLVKAFTNLSQAFANYQNGGKASHFAALAEQEKQRAGS